MQLFIPTDVVSGSMQYEDDGRRLSGWRVLALGLHGIVGLQHRDRTSTVQPDQYNHQMDPRKPLEPDKDAPVVSLVRREHFQ